ncbi:MAG: M14 family metallopeptidase [Bacteroidota bacterium]
MRATLLVTFLYPIMVLAQVQSPKDFLGYEPGTQLTRHYQLVNYFTHLADQSDWVQVTPYGKTYEQRPLLLAYVSTPKNLQNVDQIRTDNLKRAGLLEGEPEGDVAIIWLSYNVHGNEVSATEASISTIYELVRPNSDKREWLENTLVIIDPCLNPDGRDRYVNFFWENANMPYNPDPNALEHQERDPRGRSNHYLFDLNRDWAWQTQIETQQRMKIYHQWLPHVHVDFHEQGVNSPYYFAPAAQPYHEAITTFQRDFQVTIGKNNAKYFDDEGWFYFTKERFDLLYPSYGDTYPTYNGSIGMTYEQAGNSRGGIGILKQEGDTLTLVDRVLHQHTTGIATIEVLAENRARVLQEFSRFFGDKPELKYKSFILKYDGNDDKFDQLKSWLTSMQIAYGTSSGGGRGYNYQTGRSSSFSIQSEDLVVSTNQPKGRLAHILFEPKTKIVDSLTYDVTAWGVPYAYGIEAFASEQSFAITKGSITNFSDNEVVADAYALLFDWDHVADGRFLAALLKEGIKSRFTERAITFEGKRYDRGTLVVSKRDNKHLGANFPGKVVMLANQYERQAQAINTGFMDGGPDLGSSSVRYLEKPNVAIVKGDGVSTLSFGAAWHLLEQELEYPATVLGTDYFTTVDLSEYDVLIMPDGRYSGFGEKEMEKVSEWVSAGGKLIAVQGALRKFRDSDYASLSAFNSEVEEQLIEKRNEERDEKEQLVRYENEEREYTRRSSLAIFQVALDNSHPLAFGYGDQYYTLKTRSSRYGYLGSQNVGVIKSENDLRSGFAGEYLLEDIPKSLAFGVEDKGRGQIVYFVDDPLFRSFWHNGKLLFINALFFVGQ